MDPKQVTQAARESAWILATARTDQKNAALAAMADRLEGRADEVLKANEADLAAAEEKGLEPNVVARLKFGEAKIASRVTSLREIEALADPVGQTIMATRRPMGLEVRRVRVPLGVIMMIYEARPHVTVNAGAFCLKSGNAAILRGGSEVYHSNTLLGQLWSESLEEAGLPAAGVQVVTGSHDEIGDLLDREGEIDLVIPRGGHGLIKAVAERSKIPVIKHFAGVCHVYLDGAADLDDGMRIALDSKCLMPEVCNAMETTLVAESLTDKLPEIVKRFRDEGVRVKGCAKTRAAVPDVDPTTDEDWEAEYLDMVVSIRVVDGVDQAVEHINKYGSHHTDSIVTQDVTAARTFQRKVDSGVVLLNASTMFCDGQSLGMGAEIGISTDKLHARGPMGLEELTTYKFEIEGEGHVMAEKYQK